MSFAAAKRWLLAWILSTLTPLSLAAQSAKPPLNPIELFHRVSARLIDDWRRMPRYTCTQDITRRFYWSDLKGSYSCSVILQKHSERKRALPLGSTDHLELEVALADRREVHSWPGAASVVEDDEIRDLVGNGALGSGDFAGFVGAIFGGSARVTYENVGQHSARWSPTLLELQQFGAVRRNGKGDLSVRKRRRAHNRVIVGRAEFPLRPCPARNQGRQSLQRHCHRRDQQFRVKTERAGNGSQPSSLNTT